LTPKNYYRLLELEPTATADDVKRAFRHQIARYHPDKVQHLGKEFQDMAAERAAELTEAYRILSDEGRRAEYDRTLGAQPAAAAPQPSDTQAGYQPPRAAPYTQPVPPPPPVDEPRQTGPQFSHERAGRDEFVRKATLGRLRSALEAVGGYEESPARGFDLAWIPKKKLFARAAGPRLAARVVSRVDADGVADAWAQAGKWAAGEEVCVLLVGTALAPAGELAASIAEQRKKSRGAKVAVVPVDARTWDAHLPIDAAAICKTLLARLKSS
jgi:hypothetical protein